jgi:dienelactone hydrolase
MIIELMLAGLSGFCFGAAAAVSAFRAYKAATQKAVFALMGELRKTSENYSVLLDVLDDMKPHLTDEHKKKILSLEP